MIDSRKIGSSLLFLSLLFLDSCHDVFFGFIWLLGFWPWGLLWCVPASLFDC